MSLYRHYLVYRKWNRKKWTLTITSSNSHCLLPQHWWHVWFLPVREYVTTDNGVYLASMPCCFNRATITVIQHDLVKGAQTSWLFLTTFPKADISSFLRHGRHGTVSRLVPWLLIIEFVSASSGFYKWISHGNYVFSLTKLFGGVLMLYMEARAFFLWDDWHRNSFSPLGLLGSYTGDRQTYLARKTYFAQPGKESTCTNLRRH